MRRKQLIDTTHKIQHAISESELLERLHVRILALSKEGKKVPNVGDLLAALNKFSIQTSKLSDAEKEVLKQLDLHYLNDPKNWPKLISTDQPDLLKSIFSNLRRLRSSLGYFQKVISLGHDELSRPSAEDETISILLLPDENTKDTPKKLASFVFEAGQLEAVRNITWTGVGAMLYASYFGTILATVILGWLLRRYSANIVSPFFLLVPVFGMVSSYLIIGETLTSVEALSSVLVLLGLLFTIFHARIAGWLMLFMGRFKRSV